MNRTQVLAATGTLESAWQIRESGNAMVFVPSLSSNSFTTGVPSRRPSTT